MKPNVGSQEQQWKLQLNYMFLYLFLFLSIVSVVISVSVSAVEALVKTAICQETAINVRFSSGLSEVGCPTA